MGDRGPDVLEASALEHALDDVAAVRPVVDRLGIDVPEQSAGKDLHEVAHGEKAEFGGRSRLVGTGRILARARVCGQARNRYSRLFANIVMPGADAVETESSLELNFLIGKIKHTVRKVRKV